MIKNSYNNFNHLPANNTSADIDSSTLANEKRRLVNSLEAMRRKAPKPGAEFNGGVAYSPHSEAKPHPEEAFKKLDEALRGQEELCVCVQALYDEASDHEILYQNLKSATATCKMQEETIESFENKLLEAISENGKLHQEIDKAQSDLMTSRAVAASLARLRDKLRGRNEELRQLGETHRMALSAAEREILYLTARFQEVRAKS
ncbi:MAG: hypothetical protein JXA52_04595 [Planctomycetes bacterium]|nr:hypothetical protein [Planctomycetota bacterium]